MSVDELAVALGRVSGANIINKRGGDRTLDTIRVLKSQTTESVTNLVHTCRFEVSDGPRVEHFKGRVYWQDFETKQVAVQLLHNVKTP